MVNPKTGEKYPANPNRTWAITIDTFEKYYSEGKIVFPGDYDFLNISKPAFRYFKDEDMAKAGDIFGFIPVSTNLPAEVGMSQDGTKSITELFEGKVFSFPKPVELIKFLIKSVTEFSKDAIVLDFFSGSAATAHAVMQLNAEDGGTRKFICVQLPEVLDEKSEAGKAGYKNLCEIGKERIRRASKTFASHIYDRETYSGKPEGFVNLDDFIPELKENRITQINETLKNTVSKLDTGFKVFQLDSSNIKKWDNTPLEDRGLEDLIDRLNDMVESVKPDRPDLDVVYEIMLKLGLKPTYKVEKKVLEGKNCYIVGDLLLLVCLDKDVTVEIIEKIADSLIPGTIVLSDRSFKDDTAVANIELALKERNIGLRII